MKKTFFFFFTLLSLASVFADGDSGANIFTDPERVEWQVGALYEGRFSDGTAFQMTIPYTQPQKLVDAKEEVNHIAASYKYPRIFADQHVILDVKVMTADSFRMVALGHNQDAQLIDKEIFEGKWSNSFQTGKGQWTHTTSGKKMHFTLRRMVTYKGIHLTLPREGADDKEPDRPFVFSVFFPEIKNQNQRAWIESVIDGCEADLACNNSVEIAWHSSDLISFVSTRWGYSQGMAHGNGYSRIKHFAFQNGEFKPVLLNHFIDTSPVCVDRVSKKIVQKLTSQKFSSAQFGEISDWETAKFIATPVGVGFSFDPYAVGSYAQGSAYAFITKNELAPCLKKLPIAN